MWRYSWEAWVNTTRLGCCHHWKPWDSVVQNTLVRKWGRLSTRLHLSTPCGLQKWNFFVRFSVQVCGSFPGQQTAETLQVTLVDHEYGCAVFATDGCSGMSPHQILRRFLLCSFLYGRGNLPVFWHCKVQATCWDRCTLHMQLTSMRICLKHPEVFFILRLTLHYPCMSQRSNI